MVTQQGCRGKAGPRPSQDAKSARLDEGQTMEMRAGANSTAAQLPGGTGEGWRKATG